MQRLFIGLFVGQTAFALYTAALPVYFDLLGFDPARIGLLVGAVLCSLGVPILLADASSAAGRRQSLAPQP